MDSKRMKISHVFIIPVSEYLVSEIHTFVDVHRSRLSCWVRVPSWHSRAHRLLVFTLVLFLCTLRKLPTGLLSLSELYQFCFNAALIFLSYSNSFSTDYSPRQTNFTLTSTIIAPIATFAPSSLWPTIILI